MMSEGTLNCKIPAFTEFIYIIGQLIGRKGVTHCGPVCYSWKELVGSGSFCSQLFHPTAESSLSARSIPKVKGQRLLFIQASYITVLYVDRWLTRGRSLCLFSTGILVLSKMSMPSHIHPHPLSLSLQKSYAHTQGRQSSTNKRVALLKAWLLSSDLGSQCSELQMTKILFLSHSDCVDFVMGAWVNSYNAMYDAGICLIMVHVDRFIFFAMT